MPGTTWTSSLSLMLPFLKAASYFIIFEVSDMDGTSRILLQCILSDLCLEYTWINSHCNFENLVLISKYETSTISAIIIFKCLRTKLSPQEKFGQ